MKKFTVLILIILITAALFSVMPILSVNAAVWAIPNTNTVIVNGEETEFNAYLILDNNYLKLRDIAYTFCGESSIRRRCCVMDTTNYVIIETGGKQFRVSEGSVILVEKLQAEIGEKVTFDKVLLAQNGGNVRVGNPYLQDITVTGTIDEQGKHKKVHIFKYKAKSNYRRRIGHRQPFTKVTISINGL